MKNVHRFAPASSVVGLLTVALGTWTSEANGHLAWQVFLVAPLLWCLLGWFGTCVMAYVHRANRQIDSIVATMLGFYTVSVVLFVCTAVLHFNIVVGLATSAAMLALLVYLTRALRPLSRLTLTLPGALSLLVGIVLTTLWSKQNLSGLIIDTSKVTSTPWLDTLYHAIHISHFAHRSGDLLGTDPLLSTAPLAPYHYAAYMIPSLLVRTAGISAYTGTVAIFAPLGTLFTGLSAYAIGRSLIGPLAGFLAILFCLALPDPTFYLLENRWVSYFFFQQIAGNGAFGTALMGLAWAFCAEGVARQHRRWTLLALIAGATVVVFKSQIFLTYSVGLLFVSAVTFPRLTLRFRALLGVATCGLFALSAFVVLPAIPRAPSLLPGTTAGPTNLHFALSNVAGACQSCVLDLGKRYPLFLAVATPMFLIILFGLLLPLVLMLAYSRSVRAGLRPIGMWFLWTSVVNFLFIALGLDINKGYGDPFEIAHKTFVWPYLAISTWCGCAVACWINARRELTKLLILVAGLPLTLLGLVAWISQCADNLQTGFVYVGSETSSHLTMPRDAYEAAIFIRSNTPHSALVQLSNIGENLMFPAITERRTYVSYLSNGRNVPKATLEANDLNAELLTASSAVELRSKTVRTDIDYLVLVPGHHAPWEADLKPIFQSGGYRVYVL